MQNSKYFYLFFRSWCHGFVCIVLDMHSVPASKSISCLWTACSSQCAFVHLSKCGLLLSFLAKHFPAFECGDVVRNLSPQKPDKHPWSPRHLGVRRHGQHLQVLDAKETLSASRQVPYADYHSYVGILGDHILFGLLADASQFSS